MTFTHRDDLTGRRCAFIGDEPLVVQCAELATAAGLAVVAVATGDERVRGWATAAGTPLIEPDAGLAASLTEHGVDVLFSVANLRVLSGEVLRAVKLAVNFHDGPLPDFVGVHVTTWALMAGRREHAVTWHLMTEAVDAGEIITEERFALADDETAYSLNARCFEAAMRSFPRVAAAIASGTLATTAQPEGATDLCRRHRRAGAVAVIDPSRTVADIVRTVRALDLGDRTINRIGRVRLVAGANAWLVGSAAAAEADDLTPGQVRPVDGGLLVGVADGVVRFAGLTELDGRPVESSSVAALVGATMGSSFDVAAALDAVDSELSRHEASWIRTLAGIETPALPFAGDGTGWGRLSLDTVPGLDLDLAAAVTATWVARVSGTATGAVGVVDSPTAEQLTALAPLVVPPVLTVTPSAGDDRAAHRCRRRDRPGLGAVAGRRTRPYPGAPWRAATRRRGRRRARPGPRGRRSPAPAPGRRTGALALEHDRAAVSDDDAARAGGQLTAMLSTAVADPRAAAGPPADLRARRPRPARCVGRSGARPRPQRHRVGRGA